MTREQILKAIHDRLAPAIAAQQWFTAAEKDVGDIVEATATVEGLNAAENAVRDLYVRWLMANPKPVEPFDSDAWRNEKTHLE